MHFVRINSTHPDLYFNMNFFAKQRGNLEWFVVQIFFILILNLNEVELSVELAFGRSTNSSQIYPLYPQWNATTLVDGDTCSNILCNSCMLTNPAPETWWQVILDGVFSIDRVEIFHREYDSHQNCSSCEPIDDKSEVLTEPQRIKGYSIYISYTNEWNNGEICYTDPPAEVTKPYHNIPCKGIGSVITIHNNNTAPGLAGAVLEFCEVRVYGCPLGFYHDDCSMSCSHCKDQHCDIKDGVCKNRCMPGWRGPKCDNELTNSNGNSDETKGLTIEEKIISMYILVFTVVFSIVMAISACVWRRQRRKIIKNERKITDDGYEVPVSKTQRPLDYERTRKTKPDYVNDPDIHVYDVMKKMRKHRRKR